MIWRIYHITAGGTKSDDAMPHPSLEAAIQQARYLLRGGAKDVWITDSAGKRMSKSEIETFGKN
jgi:hypothetical protein